MHLKNNSLLNVFSASKFVVDGNRSFLINLWYLTKIGKINLIDYPFHFLILKNREVGSNLLEWTFARELTWQRIERISSLSESGAVPDNFRRSGGGGGGGGVRTYFKLSKAFLQSLPTWEIKFPGLSSRDVRSIQKVGAHVFRGTLINENWQLFKLQRGILWKVGDAPFAPGSYVYATEYLDNPRTLGCDTSNPNSSDPCLNV